MCFLFPLCGCFFMCPCNVIDICGIKMQESIALPEVNITPVIIVLWQCTKKMIFFFLLHSVQMGKYSQNNFISFCIYLSFLGLTLTCLTLKSTIFAYLLLRRRSHLSVCDSSRKFKVLLASPCVSPSHVPLCTLQFPSSEDGLSEGGNTTVASLWA